MEKYVFEKGAGHNDLLSIDEMIDFTSSNKSVLTEELTRNYKKINRETFIVNKNGYMFHILVRDTPLITNPKNDKRKTSHRQLYYNLRDREIYITLNNRELTINQDSLENFVTNKSIELFETDENRGMYEFMIKSLSALPNTMEHRDKYGRALIRLMESYSKLELIYKVTPMLCKMVSTGRYSRSELHVSDLLKLSKTDKTKPKDIFKVKQLIINEAEKQLEMWFEEHPNEQPKNTIWEMIINYVSKSRINTSARLDMYMEIHETLKTIADEDSSKDFIPLTDVYFEYETITRFMEAKNLGLNFRKLVEYIFYQCNQTQAISPDQAIRILTDYYRVVSHLPKYRRYPKYLKTAHDVAARNFKLLKSKDMNDGIERTYDKNRGMEMILGDYIFTIPKESSDLAEEGAMMANCVAGYARSVAIGATMIVFMRDKNEPDKSLVTVEVRGGEVVQAYKAYNRSLTDRQLVGLAKWAKVNGLGLNVYNSRLELLEQDIKSIRSKPILINAA